MLYLKAISKKLVVVFIYVKKGGFMMKDETMTFSLEKEKDSDTKKDLLIIYDALKEKGYNPVNQIVGYLLSEDPTYITTYKNARSLIRKIDRDELLQVLVKSYING